jgi:nucleotide-binding universal stress UspA family protein
MSMLRSILVALDDTPGAVVARDAAIAFARRSGASLTVAVVLDRPHTQDQHEAVPLGGGAFKAHRDARLTEQADAEAAAALAACAEAAKGLTYKVLRLEDAPGPALMKAGAAHDLIVIGRDSTLGREVTDDGVAPVIETLLRDGARPLLVVPPETVLRADGPIIAAYDGSAPAREAFQVFALLALTLGAPVRVVSVGRNQQVALTLAEEGCDYLRRHEIAAEPVARVGSDIGGLILAEVEASGAWALVMGAFGGSSLARMLIGSTTDRLLQQARVPVFIAR